ncbi:MFS transporter [bacterium]|nr:MFS transporter [bacterium]
MKLRYISQRRQLIKSFYTGIGKTAVIFPSAFLASLGSGLIALGIVFYMRDIFNASASQIGLLAALWSLCYISGCIFLRPLFDHVLPRYTMIIATFCMSVLTLSIHFISSIVWIYVLYGFFGLSTSLFWPSLMAWFSRKIEGVELGKTISKFNFSWSAGLIISPFLAGWLSERAAELPLYFGSSLFLLTSFMIVGAILVLPGIRKDRDTELSVRTQNRENGKDTPLRYPAWVSLYTTYVVMGVILIIFPVYARDNLSMSKSIIGLLLLSRALFMTIGFVILGRITFWHFKSSLMLLGQVCLAISLIFMTYVRSPLLLGPVLAFIGLLMALSYSNSLFHGVSGSTNRAKRMAIHESVLSAGFISGTSIGGVLYQRYSMSTVYWFCLSLVLVGVIIQAGLSLKKE